MCGIGGRIGRHDGGAEVVDRMRQALHHRGERPDSVAGWTLATLVHTRLSIIDLSETGTQPMANETGTVWSVFNGEIYNHRELRRHLEQKGHYLDRRGMNLSWKRFAAVNPTEVSHGMPYFDGQCFCFPSTCI